MPVADVYSLHCSAEAVIRFLERVDPQHAKAARQRYACFDKCAPQILHTLHVCLQRRSWSWNRRMGIPPDACMCHVQEWMLAAASPSASLACSLL